MGIFSRLETRLGKACEYAYQLDVSKTFKRIKELGAYLREELKEVAHCQVHDLGKEKGGIVSFSLKEKDPIKVKEELSKRKVNISVSYKTSTFWDMEERGLGDILMPLFIITIQKKKFFLLLIL